MTAASFDRLLRASRLAMPAIGGDEFVADHSIRIARPDRERLEGKVNHSGGGAGGGSGRAQKLVKQLGERLKSKPPRKVARLRGKAASMDFDQRQRAMVKVHYFAHGGTGAASLKAHAKYVSRDGASRDGQSVEVPTEAEPGKPREGARAHADYLERGSKRGVFYDGETHGVDGGARAENWAKADKRHFRLILSAEEGARLRDLPAYTREVMARAGASFGTKLNWVAVDHHDTDNPHTHIILRGRRANGQDLVLPRDFIKHGFRNLARDVATEWLGRRTPEQERPALDREARRHGPTRLDPMIAAQASEHGVRLADLRAPSGDPYLTQALKARVRELERMGLAEETSRNVFRLSTVWRERLKAMELHLDIRKRIMRERVERSLIQHQRIEQVLRKGFMDR
jgi:type IV secretory pathway VirD2 relaxase